MAKLLTFDGQVISPAAYVYAGEALGCPHFGRFES